MNSRLQILLAAGLFLAAGMAKAEQVYVVKLVDVGNVVTYELKTPEELKTLQKEIADEGKLYPKALEMAEKDWKADPKTAKKAFPASAINKRLATPEPAQAFTDRAKAEAKLTAIQERESKRETQRLEREQKRAKDQKKDDKTVKEEKARAQAKEDLEKQAAELFKTKLDELKGGGGAKGQAAGGEPKAAPAAKGVEKK